MSEELKPCPFCGGEATVTDGEDCDGVQVFFVGCRTKTCICDAWDSARYFYSEAEAIKMWNRRADDGGTNNTCTS